MELKEIILELEEEKESLQEFIHTTEWNKTNCDSLYNIVDMIKDIDTTLHNIRLSQFRIKSKTTYEYIKALKERGE